MFLRFFNIFSNISRRRKKTQPPAIKSDAKPGAKPEPPANVSGGTLSGTEESPELGRSDVPFPSPAVPSKKPSSIKNLSSVLNVLRAYIVTFGQPDSDLELRAVIGAIVANLVEVKVENPQLERFIDEAIAAYQSVGKDATLVDVTSQLLAEQVAVWLREQEVTVDNVLSAYLQQFAPDNVNWESSEIIGLVQTVIATLNDGSLSRSGGRALVNKVVETFELDKALSRWVAPEWVALAQQVASYNSKEELQSEVRSIAWAYLQQFQAILSPQLIEQIMETGPLNLAPSEVLSGNFGDFSEMLFYKFQLLEADPVVTKSHEVIAAEVNRAIANFNANRTPPFDATQGIQTGDLEISSPIGRS